MNLQFGVKCTTGGFITRDCLGEDLVSSSASSSSDFPSIRVSLQKSLPGVHVISQFTTIFFDTVSTLSTPGMYDIPSGKFTVPKTGVYAIGAGVCAQNFVADRAKAPTEYGVGVMINGGDNIGKSAHHFDIKTGLESANIYWEVELKEKDSIQIVVVLLPGGFVDLMGGDTVKNATGFTYASVRQVA